MTRTYLEADEVAKLEAAATNLRDRLLIRLLYHLGCRITEALTIGKRRPFGTVLVSIGPKGLPDDVQVVSISELARQSNRQESEVISELREHGHLLFSEEAFSRLIDRLTSDVQEGRLLLPVPTEKLAEIRTTSWVKLETEKPAGSKARPVSWKRVGASK